MGKIDLTILQKIPDLNINAEIVIEPLAPLSMVSELPGSFYKTMKSPNKKMLCGLFENILGWHIDLMDRKKILREKQLTRKKQKVDYSNRIKGSTYIPLLIEYFEIADNVKIEFSKVYFFDDLWSRSYRRADSYRHLNGTSNIDISILDEQHKEFSLIDNNNDLNSTEKNIQKDKWFQAHISQIPMYYSSPTIREYIHLNGIYKIQLSIDSYLYELIEKELIINNIGYLGNSEGWVNLKINQL